MNKGRAHYWSSIVETSQAKHSQKLWRIHSNAVNIAMLVQWLPRKNVKSLLKTDLFDEALSDGLWPLLTSRAMSVVGMDMSVSTIKAARMRYTNLRATGADARCLPFADSVFDFIVSNSTLDHFESVDDIVTSLCELYRVLRSGGQLLVTLDNLANPIIALRNALPFGLLNRLGILPYYVGATVGPRRLCRYLKDVGFEIVEVSATMHCLRVVAVGVAGFLQNHVSEGTQRRYLRLLMAFESLSSLPTRFLTGYFIAVRAVKM